MNLPPFKELEIYAAGEADLPQRKFQITENECVCTSLIWIMKVLKTLNMATSLKLTMRI